MSLLMHTGQVSERSKEAVLKTVERKLRGFESRPVRHSLLEEERKSPQLSQETDAKSPPDLGLPGGFLIRHCFIAESVPIHRLSFAGHRRSVTTCRIHRAPGFYHIQSRGVGYNIHIPTYLNHIPSISRGDNHGFGFRWASGFHEKSGSAREKGHAVRALLRPCFRLHDFAGDRVDPSPA